MEKYTVFIYRRNLLPDDNPINIEYNTFIDKFGKKETTIVGVKMILSKGICCWNKLMSKPPNAPVGLKRSQ
jgi:hypothetical protein